MTSYDRLRRWLLNKWPFAVIALLVGGTPAAISLYHSLKGLAPKHEVRMTVTVVDEGKVTAETPRRATLDVAINNTADEDIILTSVSLKPEWVMGQFWLGGEIEVHETYEVTLDAWRRMAVDANEVPGAYAELQRAGKAKEEDDVTWVKPDAISVEGIPAGKYRIERHTAERFRVRMGFAGIEPGCLRGTIRLEVKTDAGQTLVSGPLAVAICEG